MAKVARKKETNFGKGGKQEKEDGLLSRTKRTEEGNCKEHHTQMTTTKKTKIYELFKE